MKRCDWFQPTWKKSSQTGFSLLELLLVMAILLIVMTAVMGTLQITQRAAFTNVQLSDAQQNARACSKVMYDDIVTLGEQFMDQSRGAPVANSFVHVRRNFLTQFGFANPVGNGPTYTNGIYSDPTASFDRLFAIQHASNTASLSPVVSPTVATLGYYDVAANPDSTANPNNYQIYSGSGPTDTTAVTDHRGTDQLMLLQTQKIELRYLDNTNVPNDTDTNPDLVETNYVGIAEYNGSNLVIHATGTPLANMANANRLLNTNDRLLANRLEPYVDCLVVESNGGPMFLGLVTGINNSNGDITMAFDDPIKVNPNWSFANPANAPATAPKLCSNLATVNITPCRLIHYYVGTPGPAIAAKFPANFSALYRRDGAIVQPLAFNVENLQISFSLIDEIPNTSTGTTGRLIGNVTNLETDPRLANTQDTLRTSGLGTGYPYWNRTAIRAATISLYVHSDEKDKKLIQNELSLAQAADRGYYRIQKDFVVSLRNAAYDKS